MYQTIGPPMIKVPQGLMWKIVLQHNSYWWNKHCDINAETHSSVNKCFGMVGRITLSITSLRSTSRVTWQRSNRIPLWGQQIIGKTPKAYTRWMLGANHNCVNSKRNTRSPVKAVLNSHLTLRIGPNPGQWAISSEFREGFVEFMSQQESQGHCFVSLVRCITEHNALNKQKKSSALLSPLSLFETIYCHRKNCCIHVLLSLCVCDPFTTLFDRATQPLILIEKLVTSFLLLK